MTNAIDFHVDHPGVFIKDELEARGWDQSDLAFIVGTSVQQLNKILSGRGDITPKWAQQFAAAFDVNPQFFLKLQAMYDLQNAAQPEPGIRIRANWLSLFPVREMIKRGWIEDTEADLLDLQMMRFFDVNDVSQIPYFGGDEIAHAAKKSSTDAAASYEVPTPEQLVWLHRVRVIAQGIDCPNYNRSKLQETLADLRAHMLDSDDFARIPELLLECGVRIVFVEPLKGSRIDGVCTWLDDQPVIGMSFRLNRADNAFFVLRHEIEHVLQEDGKTPNQIHVDVFEPERDDRELPDEEKRADAAAAEFLIPQAKLTSFMNRKGDYISERDVLAFAARHHIHPAVVVGQIQYRRFKETKDNRAYAWLRKYQFKVHESFMGWRYRDGWGKVAEVGL